jgi:hypothetical protein
MRSPTGGVDHIANGHRNLTLNKVICTLQLYELFCTYGIDFAHGSRYRKGYIGTRHVSIKSHLGNASHPRCL